MDEPIADYDAGFRDGWLAAAEHLINHGTPETFLLGEDLRTRFAPPTAVDAPERCPYDGQTLAWHLHAELGPRGNFRTNATFIGCAWPAEHRTFHCDHCGQPAMNIDANGLCRSCRTRVLPPERKEGQ